VVVAASVVGLLVSSCSKPPAATHAPAASEGGTCPWKATKLHVLEGFSAPECATVDPATGVICVSNMVPDETAEGGAKYWGDDSNGYISRISADGKTVTLKWAVSNDAATLHSPKGLCVSGDALWVADNHQLVEIDLTTGSVRRSIDVDGAKMLNDMAAEAGAVYAADTETGLIARMTRGTVSQVKGPKGANGLAFRNGELFCASWSEHEVYRIDLSGTKDAAPVAIADKVTNLDGLEFLPDGSCIVSDQPNNRICWVSADFKRVETLVKTQEPADMGLDLKRNRLYVPCFKDGTVTVFAFGPK
jgi:DNA-binding beta-propeller fold protein YncE